MRRALSSSSALFWGLQGAFLNPVLALLLVSLFNATSIEVGWVLMVYNASGFIASLVLPAYADRHQNYLRPMLLCDILTLASGLFTNTRRVGAIISGPIIGLGSATAMGYQGVFVACAALTVVALVFVEFARRNARRATIPVQSGDERLDGIDEITR